MQVLWLTEPETWSPHATYQATRLFISNLNARLAQRSLSLVLLPHVRQDVREHGLLADNTLQCQSNHQGTRA